MSGRYLDIGTPVGSARNRQDLIPEDFWDWTVNLREHLQAQDQNKQRHD